MFGYVIRWDRLFAGTLAGALLIGLLLLLAQCASSTPERYVFGKDATEADKADVRAGVEAMKHWLDSPTRAVKFGQFTVYAETDIDRLVLRLATNTGTDENVATSFRSFFLGGGALAAGRGVYVYLGTAWRGVSPERRRHSLAHETFHVFQAGLVNTGQRFQTADASSLPQWLIEGAAEWAAAKALDAAGDQRYADAVAGARELSRTRRVALVDIESRAIAGSAAGLPAYDLGFAAVDILSRKAGETAVLEFWLAAGLAGDWRDAFSATFGVTAEAFYREFEAVRKAEFPPFGQE